jgi:nucleotide-binding universal stress UspA family protein
MKRFRNILVVCNRESEQDHALAAAVQIAVQNNASITLLQVLAPLNPLQKMAKTQTPEQIEEAYYNFYDNKLQRYAAKFSNKAAIRCKVVVGIGFLEVIRSVLRNQHDLVVKTAETASWLQRMFGSTDMHLLRKCPCAIWLLKPGQGLALRKIVATVDLPLDDKQAEEVGLNRQITEIAASAATIHNASLQFLHAWQPQEAGMVLMWCDDPEKAQAELEQSIYQSHLNALKHFSEQVQRWLGPEPYQYLKPDFELLRGEPGQILANKIHETSADLVVMGTVARTGIAGMLIGNTAETMLEQLNCSVLAIKPDGFICPVTLEH